jgi:death-on-curing protein
LAFYLSVDQIAELHTSQIRSYGGRSGLRDRGALESAAARPAMTFGGEDLYADVCAKAAALLHSLVVNHPFVDGNKRVGAHAAALFLEVNGLVATFAPKELEDITLATARGELDAERLAIWLRQRTTRAE